MRNRVPEELLAGRPDAATLAARLDGHAEILDDRPTVQADVRLAADYLRRRGNEVVAEAAAETSADAQTMKLSGG